MNRDEAIDFTEKITTGIFAMTRALTRYIPDGEKLVPEDMKKYILGDELPDEYKEYLNYIRENLK